MRQLSPYVAFALALGAQAAATTPVVGTTIDTQGYDSLTAKILLGAVTATGTGTVKLQGGEAADGSDKADIAGASAIFDDTDGNKYVLIEIHRPMQRYITIIITRATANSVVQCAEILLHGALNPTPVVQPSLATPVVTLVSPPLA